MNIIIPQVKSCGMFAQEKLNLYHPYTDQTQDKWSEVKELVLWNNKQRSKKIISNDIIKIKVVLTVLASQELIN